MQWTRRLSLLTRRRLEDGRAPALELSERSQVVPGWRLPSHCQRGHLVRFPWLSKKYHTAACAGRREDLLLGVSSASSYNSLHRLRVYDLPEDALDMAALATSSEEARLRDAPDNWSAAVAAKEGETVYDCTWFPAMTAADPVSCVFASTCRAHPVHLWDACSGGLRATYRAYDAMDEVTAANSLEFSPDGSRLYGGFRKAIRSWDTSRPGRDCETFAAYTKGSEGLAGIVSCMAFNPDRTGVMAAGSYSGQAALYDSRTRELLFLLEGQRRGLTKVLFAPDGNFLFTGARADGELWCWDVRFHSGVVYKLERDTGTTNQRISFDIEPCGRHLASGGEDGRVLVFDLSTGKLVKTFRAADDTVNGFDFHPFLPLAATASGQRRFWEDSDSESEGSALAAGRQQLHNSLLVWRFDHDWMTVIAPEQDREVPGSAEMGEAPVSTPSNSARTADEVPAATVAEQPGSALGIAAAAASIDQLASQDASKAAGQTAIETDPMVPDA